MSRPKQYSPNRISSIWEECYLGHLTLKERRKREKMMARYAPRQAFPKPSRHCWKHQITRKKER